MAQAVSRQPLTAEARLRSQASTCGVSSRQSGAGTDFCRRPSLIRPILPVVLIHMFLYLQRYRYTILLQASVMLTEFCRIS
jgi:hypothetical protein